MFVLSLSVALFLLFLVLERSAHNRNLARIPLRITVTGTRGKSSVTRMLAAILAEDGRKVLGKSTGTRACYLMPDGGEADVFRRGTVSIIEQKRLVRMAAQLEVDCLVAEVMSIHPENHFIESQQLLQPGIVVVTNLRVDHTEAMGDTIDEVASVYCRDIPPGSTVFIPVEEVHPALADAVDRVGGQLVPVAAGGHGAEAIAVGVGETNRAGRMSFPANVELAGAVGAQLGVDSAAIERALSRQDERPDQLRAWRHRPRSGPDRSEHILVSAFSANDPESTRLAFSNVTARFPEVSGSVVGLLTLRPDRADRTGQWIRSLNAGFAGSFRRLFVTGLQARIVQRRVAAATALPEPVPESALAAIIADMPEPGLVFGFGNWVDSGEHFASHWGEIGEPYGL